MKEDLKKLLDKSLDGKKPSEVDFVSDSSLAMLTRLRDGRADQVAAAVLALHPAQAVRAMRAMRQDVVLQRGVPGILYPSSVAC